jgi:signal transduction histidine kinase
VLLVVTSVIVIQDWDRQFAASGFTWLVTGVGIGLMGIALRRAMTTNDADSSYRSAVGLIRRLEALSGKLSGGLDAVGIAEQVMEYAETVVPMRGAGVFVRSDDGSMAPLRYSAGTLPGAMAWAEALSGRCWDYEAMVLRETRVAIPLIANDEMIAVLVLETLNSIEATEAIELRSRLGRHAVQLQAALLFGRVRDTATSEERQRIAREVHDGVAQDVASLGYLVDNLAAGTSDPDQQARIGQLRSEVTRVVTELRHSIFDLRHELAATTGLGESLSAYANQVSATTPMAVHVTLDEQGPRLPADVEYELLRIAQEAMANARKHSGAANLWLRCTIRPPYAEIDVRDDGTNPHTPRSDSQGLKIMRERSRSIGAELVVTEPSTERPGTGVTVRVGSPAHETTG